MKRIIHTKREIGDYETVIFLWRGAINIVFGIRFRKSSCLCSSFTGHIGGNQTVILKKLMQPQVALPKWDIFAAPFLKSGKRPVRPLVVPLWASSVSRSCSAAANRYLFSEKHVATYCLTLATFGVTAGTTWAPLHPFPMTAIRFPV